MSAFEAEQGHADAIGQFNIRLLVVDAEADILFPVSVLLALRVQRHALVRGVGLDQESSSRGDGVASLVYPVVAIG